LPAFPVHDTPPERKDITGWAPNFDPSRVSKELRPWEACIYDKNTSVSVHSVPCGGHVRGPAGHSAEWCNEPE